MKGGLKAGVGALKLGANALTAAPAIAAKAVRKGVEAGASGDVRKLGTKVGFRRRGGIGRGVSRGISRGIGRDIRRLGDKINRGRREDSRRRGKEAEAIAQSVADKLGRAQKNSGRSQTQSGSQTNEPKPNNKPEPKQQPQGAQTAAEFNRENEPNPYKVTIKSSKPQIKKPLTNSPNLGTKSNKPQIKKPKTNNKLKPKPKQQSQGPQTQEEYDVMMGSY